MQVKMDKRCRWVVWTVMAAWACVLLLQPTGWAAAAEEYTVSVHGNYRHPESGAIEDSGGEASYALGQSMVESVVDPVGLLQFDEGETWGLHLRFHLMDHITQTEFGVQEPGESQWSETEVRETAAGEETRDFLVALPSKEAVIRAECYVDAMGRSVVFYVTYDGLTTGNTTDFNTKAAEVPTKAAEVPTKAESVKGLSETDVAAPSGKAQELTLDDSFWRVLFAVVFGAAFCAGGLLLLLSVLLRSIISSKKAIREERLRKFDQSVLAAENDDFDLTFLNEEGDDEEKA